MLRGFSVLASTCMWWRSALAIPIRRPLPASTRMSHPSSAQPQQMCLQMFETVTASSATENVRQNVRQHDYYLKLQPWCLDHFPHEMGHFHWSRLGDLNPGPTHYECVALPLS